MIVLGFDTATPSTVVGLRLADGSTLRARDDPDPTQRPGHTTRLLGMADELLTQASIGWRALERIAVGLGPGTFTGLRVGIATARGLAQTLGIELVGVSSLRALAAPAPRSDEGELDAPLGGGREGLLAVIDARRGEAFAAAYLDGQELVPPRALAPEDLGSVVVAQADARRGVEQSGGWRAIGDGAVRFRGHLEAAGVVVPPDCSPLHLVRAEAICRLGADATVVAPLEEIVPDYRRRPDAEIALERARALADEKVASGARDEEGG